jgi:hypothetical protein
MHNVILGVKGVDHKDGDGLNNRRNNLRVATQAQNSKNRGKRRRCSSSPYIGVWWHKRIGKWQVGIGTNYTITHLGYFDDPIDAARAYDAAARLLHGEFARVNFKA